MKALIFDTGPVISLTLNNLLWLLEPLKKQYGGEFSITKKVYDELVEQPLSTRKFKFEALQVLPLITSNVLTVLEHPKIASYAASLSELANTSFMAQGSWIKIVHEGEMEVVASALMMDAEAIVVDERTTRNLIEDPYEIARHLERKLHTRISINRANVERVRSDVRRLKVIRSFELVTIAFELGLLDRYILDEEQKVVKDLRKKVLEGALWAIKLNGCSVKEEEIAHVVGKEK